MDTEKLPAGSGSDANQDAFPASMRKHLTSASFRPVMPINNALPNADCNDTRVGKGDHLYRNSKVKDNGTVCRQ